MPAFSTEPVYAQIFLKSFWYALATTLICLVLAYPLAALIARSAAEYRDLLLLLVILPFWSNFLIRIYAWMIILGPNAALARAVNGVLGMFGIEPVPLLFSSFAVLVCLVYVHLPFMVLPLYANLEKHDQALLDAAQDLGASAWQRFWRITFPLSLPGVYAGVGAGVHPRARHLRDPRHPGRPRRQPDRQPDQAAVPGNARLAVRQRAVDRADRLRAGARRTRRVGRPRRRRPPRVRRCLGTRARVRRYGCGAAALLAYAFLYVPLVIVVVYSFNDSRLNAEWVGFTLDWYRKLFANNEMLLAAGNSLADRPGGERACRRCWAPWPAWRCTATRCGSCPVLVLAPIAIPEILMGVSLLIFFVLLNFTLGLVSVALAHIAFCIGFVAIVVRARLAGMDESLTEAARDCGATPWQAFRYVTLPLIMPGVIAGALMAFTLSIDDFVITFFTAGAGTVTLPLQIYSMIKIAVTPEVNAVSTLLDAADVDADRRSRRGSRPACCAPTRRIRHETHRLIPARAAACRVARCRLSPPRTSCTSTTGTTTSRPRPSSASRICASAKSCRRTTRTTRSCSPSSPPAPRATTCWCRRATRCRR